jgi:hypothetical protein
MIKIPTAEELEALFREGRMERLGMGSRRVCFALPDGEFCVKGYRSEDELDVFSKSSVIREIRSARFDEKRNTSCQEYRYWQKLKRSVSAELFAAFPEYVKQIFIPSRGWCLIENVVRNADGSVIRKFAEEFRASGESRRGDLMRNLERLIAMLSKSRVRFYDPQNVMVQYDAQGNFKLRIVDFEPVSRTLIPLDLLIPCLLRFKVKRRFLRFKRHIENGVVHD